MAEHSTGLTFLERVQWLLGDRKITPWAVSIGLSRSAASRITHGNLPATDSVTRIGRVERVSLSWLLDGDGPPFLPNTVADDESGADYLDELLEEEDWSRYCVVNGDRWLLLLVQPASVIDSDQEVAYTLTEIVTGALGQETWRRFTRCGSYGLIEVDAATFRAMASGYVGPRAIIGADSDKGFVGDARTVEPPADDEDPIGTAFARVAKVDLGYARQRLLDLLGAEMNRESAAGDRS